MKNEIKALYLQSLASFSGQKLVFHYLQQHPKIQASYFIAIGKSADAMLKGVLRLNPDFQSALIISKINHISPEIKTHPKITAIESAHPVPDQSSLDAGDALLCYLQKIPPKSAILFLISGGTSSLVEVLIEGQNLTSLQQQTQQLLANGSTIFTLNQQRKKHSKIKNGGLWHYLTGQKVHCILISDVENNDPTIIGSGLLFDKQRQYLHYTDFNWKIVATNQKFLAQCALNAEKKGFHIHICPSFLNMSTIKASQICLEQLRQNPNKLHFWGAETTVILPKKRGKGGRNQHLALTMALEIKKEESIFLLVASTDGEDGCTTSAGAFISPALIQTSLPVEMQKYLQEANSNAFFKKYKALIETPNTGTNIMDIVIGIKIV